MTATDSNPELYVVGTNGRRLERLTHTRGSTEVFGDDTMPDWPADGSTVVFSSNRQRTSSDVWLMCPDGADQRPVSRRENSDDWNPRLSPDGRRIAFTAHLIPDGAPSVWAMNTRHRREAFDIRAEPDWRS